MTTPNLTPAQRRSIAHNLRHGLLCACNATLVPYSGDDNGHGTRTIGGMLHGYNDCRPVALPAFPQ